jgi:N-acetylmuramoyl-L-alanine amidase
MRLRISFSSGLTRFMVVHVVRYILYWVSGMIFWFCLDAKTTSLGQVPKWSDLDIFQKSMSRSEFIHFLDTVYCPRPEWWSAWITIDQDRARIRKVSGEDDWYDLYFSKDNNGSLMPVPSGNSSPDPEGMIIALDPGHLGGAWSEMERRHFSLDGDPPVKEGDLSLAVAQNLAPRIEALGATAVIVRKVSEPVTQQRPEDFRGVAKLWADEILGTEDNKSEERRLLIKDREELLFYRVDEIRARAELINQSIQPDLVICLHFNAAPWPDPEKQQLVERDDHHMLVNGCFMGGELAYDDQRFEMIWRLLNRWSVTEQHLAECMSRAFSKATGLPTFSYKGPNALKIGDVPGVWARNLLANRSYFCPVVFLEPYVANSQSSYPRIQKWLENGVGEDPSIITEYADAVMLGLESFIRELKEGI